jgi:hypothetical protein
MTKYSYLPVVFQVDQNSVTKVIVSISHAGLAKNVSKQAFGKNLEIISAAGAGTYILFNMFKD